MLFAKDTANKHDAVIQEKYPRNNRLAQASLSHRSIVKRSVNALFPPRGKIHCLNKVKVKESETKLCGAEYHY
jgi:hypothetical protein